MPRVKQGRGRRSAGPAGRTSATTARGAGKSSGAVARTAGKSPAKSKAKGRTKPANTSTARKTGVAKPRAAAGKSKGRDARVASTRGGRATKAASKGRVKLEPVRDVKIRELDPRAKCGPGTSVVQLFRVDELLGSAHTTHLVFYDRHGWYCEHGRTCQAVADVHKLGKRMVVGL